MIEGQEVRSSEARPGPEEALRLEVESARALLHAQQALWDALRGGLEHRALEPFLGEQRRSLEAVRRAVQARRVWFDGPGSLESWIARERPRNASLLRSLAAEGSVLKREIEPLVQRCVYLARKIASWYEAQAVAIVDWATRESTYSPPSPSGGRTPASVLDRSV